MLPTEDDTLAKPCICMTADARVACGRQGARRRASSCCRRRQTSSKLSLGSTLPYQLATTVSYTCRCNMQLPMHDSRVAAFPLKSGTVCQSATHTYATQGPL